MNRRDFLTFLGAATVGAMLPQNASSVPVKAPVSAWEQKMADDLVLIVKKRMNELTAQLITGGNYVHEGFRV